MKLVIVESPTKAKTIQKYLGKKFHVLSSYGHVRDLPKSKMGIDIENNFAPQYIIPTKARKNLNALKKAAAKADTVILATDEDREGEAIAWHLTQALGLRGDKGQGTRDKKSVERIAFHEITEEAIDEALGHPRAIDLKLVDAQQARRILDRLVGYELSPFLWRKFYRGLSAGRVQSVAVRLIVERERDIQSFKPEEYWTIDAIFETQKKEPINAKLYAQDGKALKKFAITSEDAARKLVTTLEKENYGVAEVKQKSTKKSPLPPFTTSLLQQEANRRLNMSPAQTMVIAQQLYEGITLGKEGNIGLITYMRTDSMNLSEKFLHEAKEYLAGNFGPEYAAGPRFYKSKSKNAQEAHEAIRPTEVHRDPKSLSKYLDPKQKKLYELIWKRALSSQMADAELETTTIDIATVEPAASGVYIFRATGSVIKFDGWRKLYPVRNNNHPLVGTGYHTEEFMGVRQQADKNPTGISNGIYPDNGQEQLLPRVEVNEALALEKITPNQHFTEPPPRYSAATLIKALEEYGIGRPSTYAPTVSTVVARGYVERVERQLKPTELAFTVNDLLTEHFPKIVDYAFTAKMEEELDDIAEGKNNMVPVLNDFYEPFKKNLMEKDALLKKEDLAEEKTDEICEKCGKPMIIKLGRYGKFMACTGFPECKNTKPLPGSLEAEGTDEVCEKCGRPMQMRRGRFGTFLGCTGYPECTNIKPITKKTGVKCPKCGSGDIVEKRSKKGKIFYSCSRYPDCDFSLWNKPTGEQCPKCHSLLTFAGKGMIKCSNKECDYKRETTDKEQENEDNL